MGGSAVPCVESGNGMCNTVSSLTHFSSTSGGMAVIAGG